LATPDIDAYAMEVDEFMARKREWEEELLGAWVGRAHHGSLPSSREGNPGEPQKVDDDTDAPWVFGEPLDATTTQVSGGFAPRRVDGAEQGSGGRDSEFGDADEMENQIRVIEGEEGEQVIVTTVRRRGREEEEFFEDGCEVVDFADERV